MSLLHHTDVYRSLGKADRKYRGYSVILVLFCVALAIVVASAILAPTPVGSGINPDTWFAGP
jgi:hypothetical protein